MGSGADQKDLRQTLLLIENTYMYIEMIDFTKCKAGNIIRLYSKNLPNM